MKEKDCKKIRDKILEYYLLNGNTQNLPEEITTHLKKCDKCLKYKESLSTVSKLFYREKLYTEELGEKILEKINSQKEEKTNFSILAILLAIPGFFFSTILPVIVIFNLLSKFIKNVHLGALLSIFLHIGIGILISMLIFTVIDNRSKKLFKEAKNG